MLRVAGSYRKINANKSLQLFQQIHERFPENHDCLRALIHLTNSQGLIEQNNVYVEKLEKIEKQREVRQRISSSRPGTSFNSRLSGSGKSSNASATAADHLQASMNQQLIHSPVINSPIDYSYSDPLEAESHLKRPYTSGIRRVAESYSDDEIDEDLLPM